MNTLTIKKPFDIPYWWGKSLRFWWSKKIKLPSGWADMSRRQAVMFTRLHFFPTYREEEIKNYSFRFRNRYLKYILMDARDSKNKHFFTEEDFFSLGDLQIHTLMDKMKDIFLGDSAYPALRKYLVKYTAHMMPAYNMEYSSFMELCLAEQYYTNICNGTEEDDNLANLCATLCRPQKKLWKLIKTFTSKHNGDHRIDMDSELMKAAAQEIKRTVDKDIQMTVFFFFKSVRDNLYQMYPNVYQSSEEGTTSRLSKYNLMASQHSLAREGVFGDWQHTANSNMHNVLHYLNFNQDFLKEQQENTPKLN